jgi:hypothetical protein
MFTRGSDVRRAVDSRQPSDMIAGAILAAR